MSGVFLFGLLAVALVNGVDPDRRSTQDGNMHTIPVTPGKPQATTGEKGPFSEATELLEEQDVSPSAGIVKGTVAEAAQESEHTPSGAEIKTEDTNADNATPRDRGKTYRKSGAAESSSGLHMEYDPKDIPPVEDESTKRKKARKLGEDLSLEMQQSSTARKIVPPAEKIRPRERPTRFGFVAVLVVWGILIYYIKRKPTTKVISAWIQWFESAVMVSNSTKPTRFNRGEVRVSSEI
eukprot:CAMPEP_0184488666 /NCGR_PEP_ID=MMETSP0113_2-20130426/12999_1 /TAXON_ID=91329 /ORGANISM="Norrisiella sphaerica, Strain BC52" /LENGTH=236 /DNA_ID=CAMNT_0026871603 /DNA_START=90 /DNA_END=800 /DNA_ORIENTATION=-